MRRFLLSATVLCALANSVAIAQTCPNGAYFCRPAPGALTGAEVTILRQNGQDKSPTLAQIWAGALQSVRSESIYLGCQVVVNLGTDAAPCISATLADAAARKRVAHFTGGVYRILSPVAMPAAPVTMEGDGWDQAGPTGAGTWFSIGFGTASPFVTASGAGPRVRHIGFAQDQPAPAVGWTPTAYPPVFVEGNQATGSSVDSLEFDDVMLFGIYGFAQLQVSQRPNIHHIYGEPFAYAFDMQGVADVAHVSDLHWWPFWLFAPATASPSAAASQAVIAWQNANGYPIISRRNDNPVFTDVFGFGYSACFKFDNQGTGLVQGSTSLFSIMGGGCDASQQGILITGRGTSGQIANFYHDGSDFSSPTNGPLANSFGIYDPALEAHIDVVNWHEINISGGVFTIPNDGEYSDFNVSNIRAERWANTASNPSPVFGAGNTSVIRVSGHNSYVGSQIGQGVVGSANVQMEPIQELNTTSQGTPNIQLVLNPVYAQYAWNGINIPVNSVCQVHALVIGKDATTQDTASFVLDGLYSRGTGTPTLLGKSQMATFATTPAQNFPFSAQFVVNSATPVAAIQVTQGSDTNSVNWNSTVTENCR